MCTSIAWRNEHFYFGRNLDLTESFGQQVVILPRNKALPLRHGQEMREHYAMIGMATVAEEIPLFAEAANEKGLCLAGLNFPENTCYAHTVEAGKTGVSSFELPWWILGQCATVEETKALLEHTAVTGTAFNEAMAATPLHWHIADQKTSIVLECRADGMHVYDNPFGVLANNPPFDFHLQNMRQYLGLSPADPEGGLGERVQLTAFGHGVGAVGLPGDATSPSRFVRAAFNRAYAACPTDEPSCVAQFMHMLDAVALSRGSVITGDNKPHYTLYSSCMAADSGTYYYKTYWNNRITAVRMKQDDLDGDVLKCYPLRPEEDILFENKKEPPG